MCVGYKVAEQRKTSRILIHGNMGFRAIQSVAEANFPREIHQVMLSSIFMFMVMVMWNRQPKTDITESFLMDVFYISIV